MHNQGLCQEVVSVWSGSGHLHSSQLRKPSKGPSILGLGLLWLQLGLGCNYGAHLDAVRCNVQSVKDHGQIFGCHQAQDHNLVSEF